MAKAIKNFELLQSYIFTTARYDFSIYEKRIMYCILKNLQYLVAGEKLNDRVIITDDLFGDKRFEIPLMEVLSTLPATATSDRNTNHAQVKKALYTLNNKSFEFIDEKNDSHRLIRFVDRPEYKPKAEFIKFRLDVVMIEAFLNFSKGYRKYIFDVAMSFESVYAMRFYELFSNKTEPITYSVDNLKKMFTIETKYKNVNDFKKYVLDIAKKELDEKSPFSFAYKMIKTGRKETHVLFNPYKIPKNQPPEIEQKELDRQVSSFWTVSPDLQNILKQYFGYDTEMIKKHKHILGLVTKHLDFTSLLRDVYRQTKNNDAIISVPAYLYGVFRNKLAEMGISVQKENNNQERKIDDVDKEEFFMELDKLKKASE